MASENISPPKDGPLPNTPLPGDVLPNAGNELSSESEPAKAIPEIKAFSGATRMNRDDETTLTESSARQSMDFPSALDSQRPRKKIKTFWIERFISSRGNEYFCDIDEDYLTDRFNLTGLNSEVQYYQYALDLVTDVFDVECEDEMRDQIEKSARHLYGLVHARFITTTRGLAKMLDKYKKGEFGKCPRVNCAAQHLLPTGMSDVPGVQFVKLYCPKCEDLYNPKSSRHASIDGAYFGTSFANILFQVYPALVPEKATDRYEPKVFGFKVHAAAALQRWQENKREEMVERLKAQGIENPFGEEEEADDEGDPPAGQDTMDVAGGGQ